VRSQSWGLHLYRRKLLTIVRKFSIEVFVGFNRSKGLNVMFCHVYVAICEILYAKWCQYLLRESSWPCHERSWCTTRELEVVPRYMCKAESPSVSRRVDHNPGVDCELVEGKKPLIDARSPSPSRRWREKRYSLQQVASSTTSLFLSSTSTSPRGRLWFLCSYPPIKLFTVVVL
jgi:hypothetical protein